MSYSSRIVWLFFVAAMLAGCASTKVTQQTAMVSPGLARPNQMWVYDFIADHSQIPADSSIGTDLTTPDPPPAFPPSRPVQDRLRRSAGTMWRLSMSSTCPGFNGAFGFSPFIAARVPVSMPLRAPRPTRLSPALTVC